VTTTPPESSTPDGDPAAVRAANAGSRAKVLGWARRSIDLIPTSWLLTAGGAVLLATTALFGGLQAAAVDPVPELAAGDMFAGSDLEMTVVGVELRSDHGNTSLYPDEEKGERVLVVTVDVVNTFPTPRMSVTGGKKLPMLNGIHVDGIDEPASVSRADDGRSSPVLQPDVPARLLVSWIVGPDDFRDGEEITLTLPDSTHYVGQSVMRGDYWDDVRVGATVTTTVQEVTAP
jgi:hypothetical protein